MTQEIRCTVTGRVQVVMFRDFTKRKAQVLNIVGTARNVSDGSVEVIAQGEKEDLVDFVNNLKKGPPLAHVDHVDVEWREPYDTFSSFNIIY